MKNWLLLTLAFTVIGVIGVKLYEIATAPDQVRVCTKEITASPRAMSWKPDRSCQ